MAAVDARRKDGANRTPVLSGRAAGEAPFRVARSRTGLGLFATAPIAKGQLIVEYKGRRISTARARRLEARGRRYMFEVDERWTIDGSSRRNIARYANHSCRPNSESDIVKGKVILRAVRNITPGDEITYDYGEEYFELFLRAAGCKCVKCAARRRAKRKAPGKADAASGQAASPMGRWLIAPGH